MSNPIEVVETIRARAAAATEGPWVSLNATLFEQDDPEPADYWVWREAALPYFGGVLHVESHDQGKPGAVGVAEISDRREPARERADAEFVAAARTDVPRLTAALAAVLESHTEAAGESCCREDGFDFPCATVRAITAALEGSN